jgi:hypothetical protein
MKEVVVLSGADEHVLGIYRRLEDASAGLGDKFYQNFLESCAQLSKQPQIAPRFNRHNRK